MDPRISQVFAAFHRAVLDAVAQVLPHSDATFMVCSYLVSAVDGLSGYRYRPSEHLGKRGEEVVGARFAHFLRDYFPSSYAGHAERLYVFRCRALHNFSPAHFSLTHNSPAAHLQLSPAGNGDRYLCAHSFFGDFRTAASAFQAQVESSPERQTVMLERLENLSRGGAIFVT